MSHFNKKTLISIQIVRVYYTFLKRLSEFHLGLLHIFKRLSKISPHRIQKTALTCGNTQLHLKRWWGTEVWAYSTIFFNLKLDWKLTMKVKPCNIRWFLWEGEGFRLNFLISYGAKAKNIREHRSGRVSDPQDCLMDSFLFSFTNQLYGKWKRSNPFTPGY